MTSLLRVAAEIDLPQTLEELLHRVVSRAAAVCDTENASIRLLDASGTRLLVGCRAGSSLHQDSFAEYRLGEGLVGWIAANCRPLRSGHAQEDERFVARADLQRPFGSFLGVPLTYNRSCIGVLSMAHPERDHFTEEHQQLLTLLSALCSPHLEVARLARLSRLDPVTGTLNTKGLEEALPQAVPRQSPGHLLSVALVDVDAFTTLNETHGHAAGDEVLRTIGRALASSLRVGDAVVRYGGDEFLLVLPGVSLSSASRIAERLRRVIRETAIGGGRQPLLVTVSIGLAQRRADEDRDTLVARAREALQGAQAHGGDCVRLAGPE